MAKVSLNRCRAVKARSGARRSERLSAANDLLLFAWKQGWQLGDIACDPAQQRWLSTISRRFFAANCGASATNFTVFHDQIESGLLTPHKRQEE